MKILNTTLLALSFLVIGKPLSAQWIDETYFNQIIHDVYSFDNKLHIVGNFTEREGSTCYWSATLSGTSYANHTNLIGGGGLDELAAFDGSLYGTGSLLFGSSTGVAIRSGSTWASGGSFNSSHSGIFADGDDLYVGSDFGELSKKSVGGSFGSVAMLDGSNDDIQAINKFNNEIIIAGDFDSANSVALNNIARWDGSALQPLGTGTNGQVWCMAIFNAELYIGGSFSEAGGQAAEFIAKWNGSSWTDVGGSMTGNGFNGVRDMIVYNNQLYVVGDFDQMGGVDSKYVAAWNGSNWTSLGLDMSDDFASCATIHNNRLYVGTFDFEEAHLYSNDLLPTGINENPTVSKLKLFPNPTSSRFEIDLSEFSDVVAIEVLDVAGNSILVRQKVGDEFLLIDSSNWFDGSYIVLVKDPATKTILSAERIIKVD